jgi:hypothetical protein
MASFEDPAVNSDSLSGDHWAIESIGRASMIGLIETDRGSDIGR